MAGSGFEGRVVCITGGGSGIGRAMARAFAAEGARVGVTDLAPETAEETVKGLSGSGHLALAGDVSESATANAHVERIVSECGRLDVLVNNAGVESVPGDGREQLFETGAQTPHMSDEAFTRLA